jgi:hypothetical protein
LSAHKAQNHALGGVSSARPFARRIEQSEDGELDGLGQVRPGVENALQVGVEELL